MSRQKNIIGKFYAITRGKELIEFIVYDNYTLDCPRANVEDAYLFHLKPRFILCSPSNCSFEYRVVECGRVVGRPEDLVERYIIERPLLEFMISHDMIRYSEDTAYLYGIDDMGAFDRDEVPHRYKKAIKRGPILKKQRQGKFNW